MVSFDAGEGQIKRALVSSRIRQQTAANTAIVVNMIQARLSLMKPSEKLKP